MVPPGSCHRDVLFWIPQSYTRAKLWSWWRCCCFTEPMLQVKVLYSENIRLDISMIAACPTQYWLPCFGKRTAWCWSCVDWGTGTVQLKGEAQPCCPCPCGVHLSFLPKCTEKSPCSLWSLHLSVKSLKGTPLPLQQDGYR